MKILLEVLDRTGTFELMLAAETHLLIRDVSNWEPHWVREELAQFRPDQVFEDGMEPEVFLRMDWNTVLLKSIRGPYALVLDLRTKELRVVFSRSVILERPGDFREILLEIKKWILKHSVVRIRDAASLQKVLTTVLIVGRCLTGLWQLWESWAKQQILGRNYDESKMELSETSPERPSRF